MSAPRGSDKISSKKKPLTRYEKITESGQEPAFPDIGEAGYLVDIWHDMGRVTSGGMGPVPLSWSEMQSWQDLTGVVLQPWELQMIRLMSTAYAGQSADAQEADCPAPYNVVESVDRESVEKRLARMFGVYAKKKPT